MASALGCSLGDRASVHASSVSGGDCVSGEAGVECVPGNPTCADLNLRTFACKIDDDGTKITECHLDCEALRAAGKDISQCEGNDNSSGTFVDWV